MIERVYAGRLDIGQGMRKAGLRPVDETYQSGIGTDMNNAAENSEVRLSVLVNRTNQVARFETCEAIHKIGAVQPFPCVDGCG